MNGFLSASHLTVRHELQKPNYSVRVCAALAAVLTPRTRVNTLICFNMFHIQFSPKVQISSTCNFSKCLVASVWMNVKEVKNKPSL